MLDDVARAHEVDGGVLVGQGDDVRLRRQPAVVTEARQRSSADVEKVRPGDRESRAQPGSHLESSLRPRCQLGEQRPGVEALGRYDPRRRPEPLVEPPVGGNRRWMRVAMSGSGRHRPTLAATRILTIRSCPFAGVPTTWAGRVLASPSSMVLAVPWTRPFLAANELGAGRRRRRPQRRRCAAHGGRVNAVVGMPRQPATVTIDIERCKGCVLCVEVCPPRVLVMTDHEVNAMGYRYPVLEDGCTGCELCFRICPDFCFEVYRGASEEATAS